MIYVGHFWFESHDRVGRGSVGWHGYFTCVAEAESVEKALDKFQFLLRRLRKTSTVLDELAKVHLDSCIEIKSIRKSGFLAYFKEIRGECQGAVSTDLVGVSAEHASAYHLTEDQATDDAGASLLASFLVFDE